MVKFVNENFVAVGLTDPRHDLRASCSIFNFAGAGNGIRVITPDGKPLGAAYQVREALEEWKRLPEAERRPGAVRPLETASCKCGKPAVEPPAGGLILKSYERYLDRDSKGDLCRITRDWSPGRWDHVTKVYAEPQHDHLWLTEAEWKSLLPLEPKPGLTYPVPEKIAKRIYCGYTLCYATGTGPTWKWGWELHR